MFITGLINYLCAVNNYTTNYVYIAGEQIAKAL